MHWRAIILGLAIGCSTAAAGARAQSVPVVPAPQPVPPPQMQLPPPPPSPPPHQSSVPPECRVSTPTDATRAAPHCDSFTGRR